MTRLEYLVQNLEWWENFTQETDFMFEDRVEYDYENEETMINEVLQHEY